MNSYNSTGIEDRYQPHEKKSPPSTNRAIEFRVDLSSRVPGRHPGPYCMVTKFRVESRHRNILFTASMTLFIQGVIVICYSTRNGRQPCSLLNECLSGFPDLADHMYKVVTRRINAICIVPNMATWMKTLSTSDSM